MKRKNIKRIAAVLFAAACAAIPGVAPVAADNDTKTFTDQDSSDDKKDKRSIEVTYTAKGKFTPYDPSSTDHGYLVTIPASIQWKNMPVGRVPETIPGDPNYRNYAPYSVTVKGLLYPDENLTITGAVQKPTTSDQNNPLFITDNSNLHLTLTNTRNQNNNNNSWTLTPEEVAATPDGSDVITGTDIPNTLTINGVAKASGQYAGNVTYTAGIKASD